ncbi:uncharacterized protein BDR25DRAFT_308343 [Lindgomyces ingoldianus]|uniref:Uncharacterized protein n=1 Tax=Lindgomyces ingoldianus TaxID=673940 RepID=A0ACB6RDJ6_9PLEO|nr:uncharacterized protein BDR25DRAFT_308343 [Lindgomyces ingoldianus]KAF2477409.1 hypothetical protein BDR25DRAFT_308343 [Lindgomyces ingoldianus]
MAANHNDKDVQSPTTLASSKISSIPSYPQINCSSTKAPKAQTKSMPGAYPTYLESEPESQSKEIQPTILTPGPSIRNPKTGWELIYVVRSKALDAVFQPILFFGVVWFALIYYNVQVSSGGTENPVSATTTTVTYIQTIPAATTTETCTMTVLSTTTCTVEANPATVLDTIICTG